jgi:hypothetical protein
LEREVPLQKLRGLEAMEAYLNLELRKLREALVGL